MQVKDVLRILDLGSSVAEFDDALERYFVETETFRLLVGDKGDVIAGDKGTGKTALYKILQKRYRTIPELKDEEELSAINATVTPFFQRLAQADPLSEGQYIMVWKSYVLSLVGNWLLTIYDGSYSPKMKSLEGFLKRIDLRTPEYTPQTVFSKLVNTIARLFNPKSAQLELSVTESGMPSVIPKVEFGSSEVAAARVDPLQSLSDIDDGLRILNDVLQETELRVWVVLDRLDEAFQGYNATEAPALRALFRTYLDLLEFDKLRLKLFVRRDLFRRIIGDGFVNLTHINARKIDIVWDDEDLFLLLCKRLRESPEFVEAVGMSGKTNEELFAKIFPEQVAGGEKRPTTWTWMVSRIRDGNYVKPPRNLIDLVKKAQEAQLRREDRTGRELSDGVPVFEPEAIQRALTALSAERVEDTLLAEAGPLAKYIHNFRDGKAEHNDGSLTALFNRSPEDAKRIAKALIEVGFLEQVGESYKVPALYRPGLGITQGKAF